jgi:hypothetical protein
MKNPYSRRNFIGNTAKGVAAAGLMSAVQFSGQETHSLGSSFIHHVFFWLKKPVTAEVRNKFESALKDLVKVETITDYHLGIPAPTNRDVIDNSYTYSLLATFENKEDQDIYQTHPIHLKFIEDCQDLWERVVVYDTIKVPALKIQ